MVGPGAGDSTLVDGAAWTGAGDTGRGGGLSGINTGGKFSPSEKVQWGEGWEPSETVQANWVGQKQEVWGAV